MKKSEFAAYEITGKAMEPALLEGDKVIVDTKQQPRTNAKDLGVFEIAGERFISRFTKLGHQYIFLCDNGPVHVARIEAVKIVGKVIEENEKDPSAANKGVIH